MPSVNKETRRVNDPSAVAVIAHEYPPMRGGIATLTRDYVRFLSRAAPVSVILFRSPDEGASEHGVHVHCIDPMLRGRSRAEAVLRLLEQNNVRTVLFNHCGCYDTGMLLMLRRQKIRIFTLIHGADIRLRAKYLGIRTWLRRTFQFLLHEAVIANSHSTRRIFTGRYPFTRVSVVHPGILTPDQPGQSCRERDILSVGRLVERKGFDVLLRAVAQIKQTRPRVTVTLVGDGPDRGRLEQLRDDLDLRDNVQFAQELSPDELRKAYLSHRVFCQLPRELPNGDIEGFGIVFLEAAAAGLPVVAGNSGGVADAVNDGVNGFLVDPLDPMIVAKKMKQILDDPEKEKAMGSASCEWVQKFDWGSRDPSIDLSCLLEP